MKKILIVIHGLGCGGAEKSLISFLGTLPKDLWEIDLIVANPNGMFMTSIPSNINCLKDNFELENFGTEYSGRRKKICSIRDFYNQLRWQLVSHTQKRGSLSYGEWKWKVWGTKLPKLNKTYDLAVSYMNGFPNYYVIDKVVAKRKIVWIHNEFEKLGYNYEFEYPYYKKADAIVTISQACVDSLLRVFPEFQSKTYVLENISSPEAIFTMASHNVKDDFFDVACLKLLSVGRLNVQKGFDIAIEAAKIVRDREVEFIWYILGEGELRSELKGLINQYNLGNNVKLVGIKENPYPYIAGCDLFLQTSRFEGKSIVLDEAKILCKPIIATNYVTVGNSIDSGINGLVVNMDSESIAEAIIHLGNDKAEMQRYSNRLKQEANGNEDEIRKYINLFNNYLL